MKKYLNKFPSYEDLKNLSINNEYYFIIKCLLGTVCLRFSYNEDYNRKISLDYMENGYLHSINLPSYGLKIELNRLYTLNKTNYKNLIDSILFIKKFIMDSLNEIQWEQIEENKLKN